MHDAQTIYFFPGFEDIDDQQTSILQPVLGVGSYSGYQWSMASWNCCLSGITVASNPVNANPGDTIVGTTVMNCAAGTTNCATWNVITEDQTTNQSTELSATPAEGQTFNWGFGGVLEVYNVVQCLDYPPDGSLTITSLLYDTNLNLISSSAWSDAINLPSSAQPQCNYGVTTTATKTTLTYGTGGPGFGLSVTPIAGIAVNQGSSASGAITITDVNGFTGSVNVAASNLPTGVTAELTQGTSFNTYTLTLTAAGVAALTGANPPAVMTLTASGSGVPTQTFPVNVIVNPPLTGGKGTAVDLTSAYNVYAFFDDSNLWPALNPTDSLDGAGDAYSANQLSPQGLPPMDLNLNGIQFAFGTPNQENGVSGTGANPISLPNIQSPELRVLATGVNGSQKLQTVTVTYTDDSTQTFTQTFDDWSSSASCTFSNPCALGESVALTMPYIDTMYSYPRIDSIFYLYAYSFALNPGKTVKSLTLPNNRNVVALAATLSPAPPPPTALQFIPVTPCRVADTRNATGAFGGPAISGGSSRTFDIPQSACGIPSNAAAYSLNVTVVPSKTLNYLTLWPTGVAQPYVSILNSYDGRVKANAAIVPAGTNGQVSVFASDATNVILDIDGYFVPAGSDPTLAFYPLTPCRIADTRNAAGSLGGPSIAAGASRAFPILASNCNIPSSAKAYSLNVTAVPHKTLNYLTTWPTGETQPYVSTLNAPTGTVVANAAIVSAGTSGEVSIFVSDASDVILDIDGYFAPPASGGLSLYAAQPCRVIDTRPNAFDGMKTVNLETSTCAPPSTAQAYVLNATVVPSGPLNYLTLWPTGENQPYVSTLNALDGAITSNMAIVPTNNGSIDAYAYNSTNLILDISSYFAP